MSVEKSEISKEMMVKIGEINDKMDHTHEPIPHLKSMFEGGLSILFAQKFGLAPQSNNENILFPFLSFPFPFLFPFLFPC
jgi:hypothetical protein